MKFSAQEEYGLRCILQIARQEQIHVEKEKTSNSWTVHEIARHEGLTEEYAGKLIRILGRAGLVESARGRKGGYRLAKPADRISVAEALRVLGGTFFEPDMCGRYTGDRVSCVHSMDCSIRSLWAGLQGMIDRVLSKTTLKDLVVNEKAANEWMDAQADANGFHAVLTTIAPAGTHPCSCQQGQK